MLIVTIELDSAITGERKLLGRMLICNTGSGSSDGTRGDYDVKVAKKTDADDLRKAYREPLRAGRVWNYPRLSYNVWRLVSRAILSAFPEERLNGIAKNYQLDEEVRQPAAPKAVDPGAE